MKHTILFIITGLVLVGCASKPVESTRAPLHITNEQFTLDDLCRIVEDHVYQAGIARANGERRSRYEKEADFSNVPAQMAADVLMNVDTTFRLPIKDEAGAAAYSHFVYEKCIENNQ